MKKKSLREIVFAELATPGTSADIAERIGQDEHKVRCIIGYLMSNKQIKRIGEVLTRRNQPPAGVYGHADSMDLDTLEMLAAARQRGRFGVLLAQIGGAV